jgi:hypothetical protein
VRSAYGQQQYFLEHDRGHNSKYNQRLQHRHSAFHQSEYEHFQHVEYIAQQHHEQHDVYYPDRDQFDQFHARKTKRSSLPGAFPADATPRSC